MWHHSPKYHSSLNTFFQLLYIELKGAVYSCLTYYTMLKNRVIRGRKNVVYEHVRPSGTTWHVKRPSHTSRNIAQNSLE
jgi:hypothetical protein